MLIKFFKTPKTVFKVFSVILLAAFLSAGTYIYLKEKTDIIEIPNFPVQISLLTDDKGRVELSWEKLSYPCMYKVDIYHRTTGMIESEPDYILVQSECINQANYLLPTTSVPTYYKVTAYSILGKMAESKAYIENPIYSYPYKPISIFHYTEEKPASVKPYLVWHNIPDAVIYELELLSGWPDTENSTVLSSANQLFTTQMIYTNGVQLDLTPYLEKIEAINGYKHLYWRVRAMDLKKQPVGIFSDTEEIIIDEKEIIPNKPLLNHFDRMPNFQMPIYPVYNWIPMLGAKGYEVELMVEPPAEENNTQPSENRAWAKTVQYYSFSCYDEQPRPYAGNYYWRVRALDEQGNTLGVYSDTAQFTMDSNIQRCKIATLGDSITHGGGAVSFSPASLQYSYQTYANMPIVNIGRSGDIAGTTLARFEQDVLPIHPVNLIIMTGSNNLRSEDFTAESIINDLATIAQMCNDSGIRPIFITLPPVNPENIQRAFNTPTDPNWQNKLAKINAFLRTQPYVIDVEEYFYDNSHTIMDHRWANDGLHPDIYGKMLIGEAIYMNKHLLK